MVSSLVLALLVGAGCTPPSRAPVVEVQSPSLVERPVVEPPPDPGCTGATKPYEVEARVRWASGEPAVDVAVGFAPDGQGPLTERGRTGPDGSVVLALDSAGLVGVVGALSSRPATCVRAPVVAGPAREGFTIAAACPIDVRVVGPEEKPVAGAHVRWTVRQGTTTFRGAATGETDLDGRLSLPELPCGEVSLAVERAGLAQTRDDLGVPAELRSPCLAGDVDTVRTCLRTTTPTATPPEIGVSLGAAIALRGRVTEAGGKPVEGVTVSLLLVGETQTDAEGRWELWVPPHALREKRFVALRSPRYLDQTVEVFGEAGVDARVAAAGEAPGLTWRSEVELVPTRRVSARCAGFPDDRCTSMVVACGPEGGPMVHECDEANPDTCECPAGGEAPLVMAAGGKAVYVDPAGTTAWIDFREQNGGLRGRLGEGGGVLRLDRVGDPAGGLSVSRRVITAPDGTFTAEHLAPGRWEIHVLRRANRALPEAPPVREVEVADAVVDLGVIEAAAPSADPAP